MKESKVIERIDEDMQVVHMMYVINVCIALSFAGALLGSKLACVY
jgi:hypothetical protein